MNNEQKNLHQLLMSPQLENVELAFQLLEAKTIDFNIQPYKELVRFQNYLDGNNSFEAIYQNMLWSPSFFHYATTSLSSKIKKYETDKESYALTFLNRDLIHALEKIKTKQLFVTGSTTAFAASKIAYAKDIFIKHDILERNIWSSALSFIPLKDFLTKVLFALPCDRLIFDDSNVHNQGYDKIAAFFKENLPIFKLRDGQQIVFYIAGYAYHEAMCILSRQLGSRGVIILLEPEPKDHCTKVKIIRSFK